MAYLWHTAYMALSKNDTQHSNTLPLCRVSLCWVSHFIYCHAECHYSECHYDECHYSESHYAECCYVECHSDIYLPNWGNKFRLLLSFKKENFLKFFNDYFLAVSLFNSLVVNRNLWLILLYKIWLFLTSHKIFSNILSITNKCLFFKLQWLLSY